jgi:mono/diheme cytochrome c family protein
VGTSARVDACSFCVYRVAKVHVYERPNPASGRLPGLRYPIGSLLTSDDITIRIINGGTNMPAFAGNVSPEQLADLVALLRSRRAGAWVGAP